MSKRFQMPFVDPNDPSSIQYALEQVELFLNSTVAAVEADRVESDEANLKVIRGVVNADGTLGVGSGFSPSKNGTGRYFLDWTTDFSAIPAVDVTPVGASRLVRNITESATQAEVGLRLPDDSLYSDTKFHFIAIGPT